MLLRSSLHTASVRIGERYSSLSSCSICAIVWSGVELDIVRLWKDLLLHCHSRLIR